MEVTEINEHMVFRLSNRRSPGEVKLLNLEWAVVTQLDGEKNVGQISEILALSRKETEDIFHNLLKEGLLELVTVAPDDLYLPVEVFNEIEHQLTMLIGPVSGILVDDVLKTMKKNKEQFEIPNLPILIDLLNLQISDTEKKDEFLFNTYPKIKSFLL